MLHTTSNPWLAGVQSTDDTTAYYSPPAGVTNGKTGTASAPDTTYGTLSTDHYWKFDVANPAAYGQTMSTKEFSSDYQTGQPYGSPMQVGSSGGGTVNGVATITIAPGSIIQITNVSQAGSANVNNDFGNSDNFSADGGLNGAYTSDSNTDSPTNAGMGTNGSPENGISNIYTPKSSITGVF